MKSLGEIVMLITCKRRPFNSNKEDFVKEFLHMQCKQMKNGDPCQWIIGIGNSESGYGTTRIAVNANNIFGVRYGAIIQILLGVKGQPDEDYRRFQF